MRTFEAVLIVVNVLALLVRVRNPSTVRWLDVVGSNLLALALYGGVEGFRYHLTFSYVLVPLLLVHAGATARGMFSNVRMPTSR